MIKIKEFWVIIPFQNKDTAEKCLNKTGFIGTIIEEDAGSYDKKHQKRQS